MAAPKKRLTRKRSSKGKPIQRKSRASTAAKKRSQAASRGWETRRKKAEARSRAARKAWKTRKRAKAKKPRCLRPKKGALRRAEEKILRLESKLAQEKAQRLAVEKEAAKRHKELTGPSELEKQARRGRTPQQFRKKYEELEEEVHAKARARKHERLLARRRADRAAKKKSPEAFEKAASKRREERRRETLARLKLHEARNLTAGEYHGYFPENRYILTAMVTNKHPSFRAFMKIALELGFTTHEAMDEWFSPEV